MYLQDSQCCICYVRCAPLSPSTLLLCSCIWFTQNRFFHFRKCCRLSHCPNGTGFYLAQYHQTVSDRQNLLNYRPLYICNINLLTFLVVQRFINMQYPRPPAKCRNFDLLWVWGFLLVVQSVAWATKITVNESCSIKRIQYVWLLKIFFLLVRYWNGTKESALTSNILQNKMTLWHYYNYQ